MKNEPPVNELVKEFDTHSVEVGLLVERGGEPLRGWFLKFMTWITTSIGTIAAQKGLEVGRRYFEETGKQIVKFLGRVPPADKDFLTQLYEEKMRKVNLQSGMHATMSVPIQSGESRSLYLDVPQHFVNPCEAIEIGGGQIARYPGAE